MCEVAKGKNPFATSCWYMCKYDIVVIGSGLGGLSCGVMLAKEGLRVCVVEQHRIVGGCLQSFVREGRIFDTGIHYIGSMGEGQVMRQFMKYYGIVDKVKVIPVDREAYETICIDGREYKLPVGEERFIEELGREFPKDKEGLRELIKKVMEVKNAISLEHLREGKISDIEMQKYMAVSAYDMICQHITSETLREIMGGCSLLFGGEKETACFYHYAMVMGSNIEGAYRIVGGTQALAEAMSDVIRENGGEVITGEKVTKIVTEGSDEVKYIETRSGLKIIGKRYISAIHPKVTYGMVDETPAVKRVLRNRIDGLKNSYGMFSVYVTLKAQTMRFRNTFYLIHSEEGAWFDEETMDGKIDKSSILMSLKPSGDGEWAESASIIAPIAKADFEKWGEMRTGTRGKEYEEWKRKTAEILIKRCEEYSKGLGASIEKVYSASPLTFRDYTSTPDGSAYGILKNWKNPLPTIIPTQTKLKNMLLTGQNIFVPGAIGVTMTAATTCGNIVGEEYLAKKIASA